MAVLIARRLLVAVATLAVVSALLFAAVEVLPGDAARQSLGPTATPAQVQIRREQLNLDRPILVRYIDWVGGAVQGDLGTSLASRQPVRDLIGAPLGNTLALGTIALVTVTVLTLLGGLAAGSRPGARRDTAVSGTSLLVVSLPEFVVAGVLLSVFSWQLGWLPPVSLTPDGSTLSRPSTIVLPALSVVLVASAFAVRLARAAVADVGRLPHVEAARLQGIPEHRVLLRYVLPTALGPIAQVLAFVVPFLIGGTIVVERFFDYPGLGKLLADAVSARDLPVVEGIGLLLAGVVVVSLLIADLVGLLANPKLRGAAHR
jgi:peptide/nickel transport system permease protein